MNLPRIPTEPTLNTARAIWTPPSALDNLGGERLTSGHNVGDAFPVGRTTVTYTAEDTSGNSVNCSFVVEVYGTLTKGNPLSILPVCCNQK